MRSYSSLNSRIINTSVKKSNLVANAIESQYLGNVVQVSSGGSNADLSRYALLSYVDASLNLINNNLAVGSTGYSRSYIDASFNSVYTKSNIDASFNSVYTKSNIDASFYTKSYVDASFNSVYTKSNIDGSFYTKTYVDASFGSVYTKSYVDASFGSVYTKSNIDGSFYTKSYIDASFGSVYTKSYVDGSLNNFYSKTYIDGSLNNFYSKTYIDGSLNNFYPKTYVDGSLNNFYSKTYIDGSLNNFYRKAYIDASFGSVYTKTYIDTSFNNVYTKSYIDASFGTAVIQNTSSNVTLNGKLLLALDASLNQKLFVGQDASLNQKLFVGQDASLNQKLFVGQDVSVNQNLYVSGKAAIGKPPASVLYEVDISGQVRIYEPSGSNITTNTSVATLTLEHGDASGCSSIMFKSPSTASYGDYAYIKYQDLSGATTNSGLLTIGIQKDQTTVGTADKISLYTASGLGYVGVNTVDPLYNLDISGNANVSNTLTTNTLNTTTTTSNLNLGTNVAGSLATNGVINIGQISTTSSAGTINIGSGTGQTGAINIGSGASIKSIAIGSTSGGATSLRGGDISLNGGASGTFDLFSTSTTGGSITLGAASGNQTLTIQRPIRLVAGSDPTSVTTAIGYQMANVSTTSGVIAAPTNRYTFSTGLMTLGVGVWMVSLTTDISSSLNNVNYTYNMGLMSSAPTTGDSASASSAPANTISGVNGNQRNDNNSTINNGTYIYQVGGVVLNNYAGTYNSLYGIYNAKWGTGSMAATLTLRAARIA